MVGVKLVLNVVYERVHSVPRICDDVFIYIFALCPQVLKRPEYFGRFGKIHKVVINNSTSYAGSQVRGWIKLTRCTKS